MELPNAAQAEQAATLTEWSWSAVVLAASKPF